MKRTLFERIEMFKNSDIYPVITSDFCNGRNVTDVLFDIARAGAKIVQIREKTLPDAPFFELLKKCREITDSFNMLLIVDDRVDAAMAADADGVHLGQDDFPLTEAKKLAPELLFGISTHNDQEIKCALDGACGYLNIGPMFPTGTKALQCGALGLETIDALRTQVTCPYSVMGGIKEKHLDLLISKGFKHIAMVTEVTQAVDITAKVKQLRSHWR